MRDAAFAVRITLEVERAPDDLAFVVDDDVLIVRPISGVVLDQVRIAWHGLARRRPDPHDGRVAFFCRMALQSSQFLLVEVREPVDHLEG